ncbi:MAG: hypothetical protein ACNA7U_07755, partial [Candidatus Izemoplasmataceae bacterium]
KREKLDILDLLDKKEITLEEAQKRLEALKEAEKEAASPAKLGQSSKKSIKIQVNSSDGDIVNIQVPVNFARLILKGGKKMNFNTKLNEFDIDFEEVFNMIDQGELGELINIESADGDTVRIAVE